MKYNLWVMSLGFMVLFAAYNTVQNYVTTLLPDDLGNESLTVLYGTVALTIFLAPVVAECMGEKRSMLLGGTCYVVYLASLIYIAIPLVLASSVVIGFGSAVLWVAQGSFLVKCSTPEERGFSSGLFWTIFQLCNVFGNLSAYVIIDQKTEPSVLFTVFTITGAVGVFFIIFLLDIPPPPPPPLPLPPPSPSPSPPPPLYDGGTTESTLQLPSSSSEYNSRPEDLSSSFSSPSTSHHHYHHHSSSNPTTPLLRSSSSSSSPLQNHTQHPPLSLQETSEQQRSNLSFLRIVKNAVVMFSDHVMVLLLPMFFWTGFELSFWTGEFPQLFSSSAIGLVLTAVGLSEILFGVLVGRLSDTLGRARTVVIGTVLFAAGLIFCATLKEGYAELPQGGGAPWSGYVAAILLGAGDSVFNTQVYAILGDCYPEKSVGAFTLFQLFQNLGSAVGFYYAIPLPLHGHHGTFVQLYVLFFLLALSTACYLGACYKIMQRGGSGGAGGSGH